MENENLGTSGNTDGIKYGWPEMRNTHTQLNMTKPPCWVAILIQEIGNRPVEMDAVRLCKFQFAHYPITITFSGAANRKQVYNKLFVMYCRIV